MKDYEMVVGLEVHAELNTKSKIYCNCRNAFGLEVNSQVCPVCMGMPGTLPTLNEKVVEYAIKMGHAMHCQINGVCKQDRKNYFYPDLPKAYQISQAEVPLCGEGYLDVMVDGKMKRIGVTRIHIEEDAGKLLHDESFSGSLVDLNRCGVPLIEIVSEPDIRSSAEAKAYLETINCGGPDHEHPFHLHLPCDLWPHDRDLRCDRAGAYPACHHGQQRVAQHRAELLEVFAGTGFPSVPDYDCRGHLRGADTQHFGRGGHCRGYLGLHGLHRATLFLSVQDRQHQQVGVWCPLRPRKEKRMAYVTVPKDLTHVKSKVLFGLTKRQLVCFGGALLTGGPLYFLTRDYLSNSAAALLMIFAMLPGLLFALFERHGQPLEVVIQQMIQCCFIRPKERPYQTNNAYAALVRQYQMEQEVKAIVQKNDTPRNRKAQKAHPRPEKRN